MSNSPSRSLGQIAASSQSVKVYLEPVILAPQTAGSNNQNSENVGLKNQNSLGLQPYIHPQREGSSLVAGLYRVIGIDGCLDCDSTFFIYAVLPELEPDPKCGLTNTGFVEVPRTDKISYVEMKWGCSLLELADKGVSGSVDIEGSIHGSTVTVAARASVKVSTPWGSKSYTETIMISKDVSDLRPCVGFRQDKNMVQLRGDLCLRGNSVCLENGQISADIDGVPWYDLPGSICVGIGKSDGGCECNP